MRVDRPAAAAAAVALALLALAGARVASAQRPGDCLRLTYTPDSLTGYLPGRLRLGAAPARGATYRVGRRAWWAPASDAGPAHAAWRVASGVAVWHPGTRSDSLLVEYGVPETASPYAVLRLGPAGRRRWRGSARYAPLNSEVGPPVEVRAEAALGGCGDLPRAG